MSEKLFEQATRSKLRFKVSNGIINTEDLWDLSLPSLDAIAKNLNKLLKEDEEVSFIDKKSPSSKLNELRFEVVKHIILVKLNEKEIAKENYSKAERKETILKILESKQNEELQSKSKEDLIKELESLG